MHLLDFFSERSQVRALEVDVYEGSADAFWPVIPQIPSRPQERRNKVR